MKKKNNDIKNEGTFKEIYENINLLPLFSNHKIEGKLSLTSYKKVLLDQFSSEDIKVSSHSTIIIAAIFNNSSVLCILLILCKCTHTCSYIRRRIRGLEKRRINLEYDKEEGLLLQNYESQLINTDTRILHLKHYSIENS
ncbi:hypothetical protein POWCR01_000190300 [Plasmodium ovale]|uniref:PIR protein n=1 Tax=Plasmodium ovale TaxID=36330 RepID=A0A1C3KJS7_PLAOA|nr:hypothetical protein POWCR01_000190300 [Plasmodium ovale]